MKDNNFLLQKEEAEAFELTFAYFGSRITAICFKNYCNILVRSYDMERVKKLLNSSFFREKLLENLVEKQISVDFEIFQQTGEIEAEGINLIKKCHLLTDKR